MIVIVSDCNSYNNYTLTSNMYNNYTLTSHMYNNYTLTSQMYNNYTLTSHMYNNYTLTSHWLLVSRDMKETRLHLLVIIMCFVCFIFKPL